MVNVEAETQLMPLKYSKALAVSTPTVAVLLISEGVKLMPCEEALESEAVK
jgi:hypothetical protein